jgi:hypothetical protein
MGINKMKTKYNWTRVQNDINGNPRYVVSWLELGVKSYGDALNLTRCIGGEKFHNKQYGGGIVFQSYSLPETEAAIDRVIGGAA